MVKITAVVVASAIGVEAILPHHEALPHIELDAKPPSSGLDSASIGGGGKRLNDGITMKLIPMNDLVTMPHTGRHLSLKEIRMESEGH
jgi:hypothetical protein